MLTYRAPDYRAVQASWVDDVVRRRGIGVYEEMLYDAQVASSSDLLKFAILSLKYSVNPPEGMEKDAEALKAADLGRQMADNFPGGLPQLNYELMSCTDYGYSITETLWEADGAQWKPSGHLALPPALYGFKLDPAGRVNAVTQLNAIGNGKQLSEFPLEHFIVMRWNPRFGGPYGRSQLRKAYEPWWMKQLIRRFRNTTLDRFGAPLVFFKVPKGTGIQDRNKLKTILENLYAESGAVIDSDYELQLVSGEGSAAASGFQEALMYEDAQIAKAITGVSLNANEAQGAGSYAQSKVHQDNFLYYVEYGAQLLSDALTQQLIHRICIYNLGTPKDKLPVLTFEPVRGDDVMLAVQAMTFAQQANIIAPDKEFGWMRERLGLPGADDEVAQVIEDRANKMAEAAVQQQQMAAQPPDDGSGGGDSSSGGGSDSSDGSSGDQSDSPDDSSSGSGPDDDSDWKGGDYSKFLRGFVEGSQLFGKGKTT
jgi:phage gp29-like protein